MLPVPIPSLLARDGWTLRGPDAFCGGHRLSFFLGPDPRIAEIARRDAKLSHLAVVVTRSNAELERLRQPQFADRFPRTLFVSREELAGTPFCPHSDIACFEAEVLANTPVGQGEHHRLAFKAPALHQLEPPQFLMMDTTAERVPLGARTVGRRPGREAMDWQPRPLLKRPFGVCRAFRPHFPPDCWKRWVLPPSLAPFLHLPAPDRFELLYKVLPDGIGTPRMKRLRPGERVHMIGPLGRPLDVRCLRARGVEEVHVVGGGVGMAPLILLVEMLRLRGFRVKVFLGVGAVESLRYRDELAARFGEKPRDAYVYLDDLLAAGVPPSDLFISCQAASPLRLRRVPRPNLFHGVVPEQYRRFLAKASGRFLTIACGPNRMMEMMTDVCRAAGVPLKVLLEKRMGCGTGVCFSCVQKVRRADGTEEYVRVCKEGPLFDAKDIVWNPHDSK